MRLNVMLVLGAILATGTADAMATTLPDSCGSDQVKFKVTQRDNAPALEAADPGKAQVVLIETLDPVGKCIGCEITGRIGVDGAWVGANKGSSYFAFSVEPGSHNLCANWQSRIDTLRSKVAMVSLNAEAGKTYYYKLNISLTSFAFDLVPVTEEEGKYRMKLYSLSESRPAH